MSIRFAINGIGRIGRALIRIAAERPDLELVAVNDLAGPHQLAPLLARDSLHGAYPGEVSSADDKLILDGREIAAFQEPDPEKIPWLGLSPSMVVEATGRAKTRETAGRHRRGSVGKSRGLGQRRGSGSDPLPWYQ